VTDLEQRVERLEAVDHIRQLLAAYCFAVDDRDTASLSELFTRDGCFRSADGVLDARGRDAVVEQFRGRFSVLGPSNHVTHDRLLRFSPTEPGVAYGKVNAHAEVVRNGITLVTALRYQDTYRYEEGHWRFADRLLSFLYYLPATSYAQALAAGPRMQVYEQPGDADWPEKLPSWQAYYSQDD